jgi:hypothetical protein
MTYDELKEIKFRVNQSGEYRSPASEDATRNG